MLAKMGRNKMQIHHLHVCIDSIVRRMQRPNHKSVLPKIATMMMTVDITDCESCPDFFLLWRRKEQRRKRTIVVVVTGQPRFTQISYPHLTQRSYPHLTQTGHTLTSPRLFDSCFHTFTSPRHSYPHLTQTFCLFPAYPRLTQTLFSKYNISTTFLIA